MTDHRPILPRRLRRLRNKALRWPIVTTTDIDRAERSEWTWGMDGPDATTARITGMSLIHDVVDVAGWTVHLWVPWKAPAHHPAWDDALLVAERTRPPRRIAEDIPTEEHP